MEFNIEIRKLDCVPLMDNLQNVVTMVHWSLIGKMNNIEQSINVSTKLCVDHTNENNFLEYYNISEDIMIEWVKSQFGEEQLESLKARLINQIKEIQSPMVINLNLPWL